VLKGWEMVIPILSRGERARITLPAEVTSYIMRRSICLQFTSEPYRMFSTASLWRQRLPANNSAQSSINVRAGAIDVLVNGAR
jgi:hypothetical protein